ncbi:MAG TPA: hypothetical protein VF284_10870 [Rhodanobacteraceae bacterium]
MNMAAPAIRARRLRALEVEPLQLRRVAAPVDVVEAPPMPAPVPPSTPSVVRKLALQPDRAELGDPAISKMYTALTEAVGKAGLERIRVCDVAADPAAAVMVFGAAPVPDGVPGIRVLRADPLSVLHTDRERKRMLWERLQALARGERG